MTGADCALGTDCASHVCDAKTFTCDAPTDKDGVQNDSETDIDCGGGTSVATDGAPPCADGKKCLVNADCVDLVCDAKTSTCDAPSCSDGVQNGTETDVDCGGSCPACVDMKKCSVTGDCESGVCTMNVCAPPACAPTCADGAACGANGDCGSQVCTAGKCAPPACAPTCAAAAACGSNADCASHDCHAGVCVNPVSCAALLADNPTAASGAYTLAPVGTAPFTAYCDMTDDGGGWTLVAKMNGANSAQASQNFTYASTYWTNTTLLNPTSTDLSQTEAKFQSFISVPFANILGMMTGATTTKMLVIPAGDKIGMQDLIANTATNTLLTKLGRTAWIDFTDPDSAPQANCNTDGINMVPFATPCVGSYLSNSARVRIGILMNQENDCCSPDSYVGFGGDYYYNTTAACTNPPSAGSLGGTCFGGGASVYDFGYLFVR
jgi:hypothetical protein